MIRGDLIVLYITFVVHAFHWHTRMGEFPHLMSSSAITRKESMGLVMMVAPY